MTTATAQIFRLPDLGEGLTEAGLVQWLVQVGDEIATDQVIAEVETAKSVVELPSPFAGVITALHGEPGETLTVGAPVLEVASEQHPLGDDAEPPHDREHPDDAEKHAYRAEERAGSGNVLIGYGTTERATTGRRRPRAVSSSTARDLADRTDSSREQSGPAPKSRAIGGEGAGPVAVRSPIVRRLARDLGVDVHSITGTGADGAITRADVLRNALDAGLGDDARLGDDAARLRAPDAGNTIDGLTVSSREPLSPMRRAISAKLSRSRAEIPDATVWVDVDATELWQLRAQIAPAGAKAPSITALVARFTLLALTEFPLLAARLSEDATGLITFEGVNLGVATNTERGLMVPVLADAHNLSLDDLDQQLTDLASTARTGKIAADRLRGSTFTLNNYGVLGVDGSAAIINHPEVAILGIGQMIERPWVVDGQIVARRIAQLSLVFDHRVCDGGYAAGFLRRVAELIEHPLHAFGRI